MSWEIPWGASAELFAASSDMLGDSCFTTVSGFGAFGTVGGRRSVNMGQTGWMRREINPTSNDVVVAARLQIFFNTGIICQLLNASFAEICNLYWTGSQIQVRRGATVIDTTPVISSQPFMFEFVVQIGTSGTYELWIDGVKLLDGSGDTENAAGPAMYIDYVSPNAPFSGNPVGWVEWYAIPRPASAPRTLGGGRFFRRLPTGDGVVNQFTRSTGAGTHASHADETPQHNSDTDYLETNVVGNEEDLVLQTLAAAGVTTGVARMVIPFTIAKRPAPGAANQEVGYDDGGSQDYSPVRTLTDAGYRCIMGKGYTTRPVGGGALNNAIVDALKLRVRSA